MDTVDLIQMRINLHNYKKYGKEQTISILKQLSLLQDLSPNSIKQSKIYKSVSTLSKLEGIKEADHDFSSQDILRIRDLAKTLVRQLKDILKTEEKKIDTPKVLVVEQAFRKDSIDTNEAVHGLVGDLLLAKDFPELRRKVIEKLISVMMDHTTNSTMVQYTGQRVAQYCRKLEDEAHTKYQQNQYKDTIKEIIKRLNHDQDCTIRSRLLRGMISPAEAVLMRTKDWMGDQ